MIRPTDVMTRLPLLMAGLLLAPGFVVAQAQQTLPAATIKGIVIGADTGQPLRRARVTLSRAQSRVAPLISITGADGRFHFPGVTPGNYRLQVERNGYIRQEYGQRTAAPPGTPLTIQPGQNLDDLEFRLIRGGVITGRVYDEEGEPLARAQVRLLRYGFGNGRRNLTPTGGESTNDLGEYRIFDLPPGRYYLTATLGGGRGGRVFLPGTGDDSDEDAYPATYYPGTTDPARAIPVELGPGQQLSGIDFAMVPSRTIRVSGVVTSALTGQLTRRAQVWLLPRDAAAIAFVGRNTVSTNEAGGFSIRVVTPGAYYVLASTNEEERTLVGRVPIEIGTNDVEGLRVSISPGMILAGKVIIEGGTELPLERLRVILRPREAVPFFGGGVGSVKADGTFQVQNVVEDLYSVTVGGAPEDFYLKSVRVETDEVLERGLPVTAGRPPASVEVTLSAAGARAEGLVLGDDGLPAMATVALIPTGERRKLEHLVKSTSTDQLGRFALRGIAPGEYKLVAFEEVEDGTLDDPDFLKTAESRGVTLRLAEGSVQAVELKRIAASSSRP